MGRIRLRINCIGVIDALEFETRKALGDLQVHDVRDLGYVIMSLAAGTEVHRGSDTNISRRCDMFIAQNFSRELHSLLMQLLIPTLTPPSIFEICSSIASHAFDELDSTFVVADRYEYALASEYDSGRALRLLLKLGFVNERPEFLMNRRWTESGDCYVLKLFRDYGTFYLCAGRKEKAKCSHGSCVQMTLTKTICYFCFCFSRSLSSSGRSGSSRYGSGSRGYGLEQVGRCR
jgi:PAB-dependent poly(A)-specific ribonuclease subunit 3